jgi:hypothetical protein
MESLSYTDNIKYMNESKKNIDAYINKNDYRKAFGLLLLVLGRLDNNQKKEFIDYYSLNMEIFGILKDSFPI